ncbi:MAG: hydrogenase 3 maturation endopeptidase HyCI [Candidatus Omnitrophota bacterium]
MQDLTRELKNRLNGAKKIALLGVGSEFRADDAAGMLVAERIDKETKRQRNKETKIALKVFLGATAPENLTGEIIKFKPSHIIIVDTADIKQKPGTILLIETKDLGEGVSFSTHKLPPKVMMDYFIKLLKCKIMVIGIQPKSIIFGKAVSKEVLSSVKEVSKAIIDASRPGAS